MLGFGATGQFAIGQVASGHASVMVGVHGTGDVGAFFPITGSIPAVYGTGAVGVMIPSTLQINYRRLLANVLRRLRTLGTKDPAP